jgi:hypothetical protein
MSGLTCPSAPAEPGVILLGIKGAEGRIVPMRTAMKVDREFLDAAAQAGPPEARMRFAAPCQKGACAQWTGTHCGVAARVLEHMAAHPDLLRSDGVQPCLIRATCRWFAERGAAACQACDLVVTDQAALAEG